MDYMFQLAVEVPVISRRPEAQKPEASLSGQNQFLLGHAPHWVNAAHYGPDRTRPDQTRPGKDRLLYDLQFDKLQAN